MISDRKEPGDANKTGVASTTGDLGTTGNAGATGNAGTTGDANTTARGRENRLLRQAKRWKTAFRLLAASNVVVLVIVVALLLMPVGGPEPFLAEHPPLPSSSDDKLLITAGANDLNTVVNRILAPRQHENLRYGIVFGELIRLRGALDVLGHDLEMEARFHPEVLDNGDLLLITDSMRIGLLPAPASKILGYVRTYYELPEWVVIEDGGRQVRLRLTQMPAGEGLLFRVLEMDAEADRYTFSLSVK